MPLIADRSEMLAPGACFLCELSPNEGEPVFDSLKEYTPGFGSPLAGRKYICLGCGTAIGEAFGFVTNEKAEANAQAAADADARVAAIVDQVASVVGDLSPEKLQAAVDGHPRFVAQVARSAEDVLTDKPGVTPDVEPNVPNVEPDDEDAATKRPKVAKKSDVPSS